MVRPARRPHSGAAAPHPVDLALGGDADRRPGRSARHQSVHLFSPLPGVEEGRVRRGRQGRYLQHGFGQSGLLHRIAACCRRRDGHVVCTTLLPLGSSCRCGHTSGDRRGHGRCRRHLCRRLATRNATFETAIPTAEQLRSKWLPGMAWVAELGGQVVGWTAIQPSRSVRATPEWARPPSMSLRPLAVVASGRHCCSPRSTKPTKLACGHCRPRSFRRTVPVSRCTVPPGTEPWQCGLALLSSTASGVTPSCWNVAATSTDPPDDDTFPPGRRVCRRHRRRTSRTGHRLLPAQGRPGARR